MWSVKYLCPDILFNLILLIFGVSSTENVQIECDAISNTDFGRRFCFIRHWNNKTLHNVTFKYNAIAEEKREVIFDNCTLNELPLGIFEHFPNIKTVYAWNTKLKKLTKEMFKNAKQLTLLDLSKNHIGYLDQNTFCLAHILSQLDISTNLIEAIHVDAFAGLGSLRVLSLEHNKLQFIPANSFVQLSQLKTIRLNHNVLKMIPVELFGQNERLQNIYLNDNAIEWISGEQTFRHLQNVNEFDLHNNPVVNLANCIVNAELIDIRNTNARGCYIGSRTKRILANDNQISLIDSGDAIATHLEHVELGRNRLEKMRNLTKFKNLRHLDLTSNRIIDFDLTSFANMDQLEVLKLRNSGLSKIYFGMLSHKSRLKILDISYNNLGSIDFRMFLSMSNLVQLQLDGNKLNQMDASEIRKIFPSLTKIGISANNWLCQNLASIIKQLEGSAIELTSFNSTKNIENIKGIPCSSDYDKNITDLPKDSIHGIAKSVYKNSQLDTFATDNRDDKKYRSSDITNVQLMLRLMELKYDLQSSIKSLAEIEIQLEDIVNSNNNN